MAKGSSINGNGDGANGGNATYNIRGRGTVSRAQLVREIKQGMHPDTSTYTRNNVTYARNKPNTNIPDNIND